MIDAAFDDGGEMPPMLVTVTLSACVSLPP
jgi:hypothetical protein